MSIPCMRTLKRENRFSVKGDDRNLFDEYENAIKWKICGGRVVLHICESDTGSLALQRNHSIRMDEKVLWKIYLFPRDRPSSFL